MEESCELKVPKFLCVRITTEHSGYSERGEMVVTYSYPNHVAEIEYTIWVKLQ